MKATPERSHLALADGTVFEGVAFGAPGNAIGEAVFTTAMTGYEEILTDPSYTGQLVTMTVPEIGNYGVNLDDQGDFRPGQKAAQQHGVAAPLLDAGLGKEDIRQLAREAGPNRRVRDVRQPIEHRAVGAGAHRERPVRVADEGNHRRVDAVDRPDAEPQADVVVAQARRPRHVGAAAARLQAHRERERAVDAQPGHEALHEQRQRVEL